MAEKSAFEKIHIDESEKSSFEGLLEQLNLPPKVVTFIRENIRLVQIVTAIVVITVVTWALYGSYRDNRIEKASSALSAAMDQDGEAKLDALKDVSQTFGETNSAQWAKINLAHEYVKREKFDDAIALYKEVRTESEKQSLLLPLLADSLAQLYVNNKNYSDALAEYDYLKTIKGYESIGYFGLGRTYELMAEKEKALAVYEEYKNILIDEGGIGSNVLLEEKIARIKASL